MYAPASMSADSESDLAHIVLSLSYFVLSWADDPARHSWVRAGTHTARGLGTLSARNTATGSPLLMKLLLLFLGLTRPRQALVGALRKKHAARGVGTRDCTPGSPWGLTRNLTLITRVTPPLFHCRCTSRCSACCCSPPSKASARRSTRWAATNRVGHSLGGYQ